MVAPAVARDTSRSASRIRCWRARAASPHPAKTIPIPAYEEVPAQAVAPKLKGAAARGVPDGGTPAPLCPGGAARIGRLRLAEQARVLPRRVGGRARRARVVALQASWPCWIVGETKT